MIILIFLRGALGSSLTIWKFEIGTRYDLEILHKCGKKFETISQKMFGSNPCVCRTYSAKTGRGTFSRSGGGGGGGIYSKLS